MSAESFALDLIKVESGSVQMFSSWQEKMFQNCLLLLTFLIFLFLIHIKLLCIHRVHATSTLRRWSQKHSLKLHMPRWEKSTQFPTPCKAAKVRKTSSYMLLLVTVAYIKDVCYGNTCFSFSVHWEQVVDINRK